MELELLKVSVTLFVYSYYLSATSAYRPEIHAS